MQVKKRKITTLDAYVYAKIALMHIFRALTSAEALKTRARRARDLIMSEGEKDALTLY